MLTLKLSLKTTAELKKRFDEVVLSLPSDDFFAFLSPATSLFIPCP
jgi:hypothetical protein